MTRSSTAGAACLMLLAACGGSKSSPAAPSPTAPTVEGEYVGTYVVSACSDEGFLAGGPIGTSGTFQGSVAGSGSVTGSAALGTFVVFGVSQTNEISTWNTSFAGESLTGSFVLASRTASPQGSRTITASIQSLTRVMAAGTVGGIWIGRALPADGALTNTSNVTLALTQSGANATGTIALLGLVDAATYRGPVSGTVSDSTLTFTFTAPSTEPNQTCGLSGSGSAQVEPGTAVMRGNYTGTNSCPGGRLAAGQFSLTRQ